MLSSFLDTFVAEGLVLKNGNQKKRFSSPQQRTAEYFTGTVRIDPLFQAPDPARVVSATVTFEPGARTAWHTHPLDDALEGRINPGRVFDFTTNLNGIAEAYAAMDDRRAIKSLVKVGIV